MKRITDQEAFEKIAPLWCQHCKAIQKTHNTPVACWYNPFLEDKRHAFCGSCLDAVMDIRDLINREGKYQFETINKG